ncbi:hypothetical protein BsIDN1_28740 [Bacillus safensis]|uniref:EngC GTPase domain-containing protein n=1 Tax=Bacillus safensis TaxID=561879 RepID=A0A5S9MCI6_BACIA|nr:hypothetical protein BsIDN1_28740 [Bacillus safensis]
MEANDIKPIICITKVDLLKTDEERESIQGYAEDYRQIGYDVHVTSTIEGDGIEKLTPHFHNKITVFAGQSGVGKSSLLNAMSPDLALKTNDISSHLGRGSIRQDMSNSFVQQKGSLQIHLALARSNLPASKRKI